MRRTNCIPPADVTVTEVPSLTIVSTDKITSVFLSHLRIYKKRFVSFSTTTANSVPAVVARLTLAETCTIMSAKLSLACWNTTGSVGVIQEARFFLYCRRSMATDVPPDPTTTISVGGTIVEVPQVDGLNGFYVGSIFATSLDAAETTSLNMNHEIHEKFRFMRKCDIL